MYVKVFEDGFVAYGLHWDTKMASAKKTPLVTSQSKFSVLSVYYMNKDTTYCCSPLTKDQGWIKSG